jgi:hypothetical protein
MKKDFSDDRYVAPPSLRRSISPQPHGGKEMSGCLFEDSLPAKPGASVALSELKPLGSPNDQPADTKCNPNPQQRKSVVAPQFCSPGDGLGKAALPDANDTDGESKIAVILKFQLNTSNYATIVLRELMGNVAEDENSCNQPHGQQSHPGNRSFRGFTHLNRQTSPAM